MEENSDFAVLLLLKDYYHQWTDPTMGQDHNPQSGRTHQGLKLIQVHKVDGPHQGLKLIQVHKVDEPHQGSIPQSTKWTDPTRVSNFYKSTK